MPAGLSPADRKLVAWAAAFFALLLIATIALTPSAESEHSVLPSSYSYFPEGSRAAYLLLEKTGFDVRRWEEPPLRFSEMGRGVMLILAEPNEFPSRAERRALLQFLHNGGRILFCGGSLPGFVDGAKLSERTGVEQSRTFRASLPTVLSEEAETIAMRPSAFWGKLGGSQLVVYGGLQEPVVVSWRIGAGELIWWAAATPLTNYGIGKYDNLQLFLNTVAPAGSRLKVYWDEYFHGERTSLPAYILRTPVRWALLQLLFIALAALFTHGRRSGPVIAPAPLSRLAPLEFVDTLGALYEHAGATAVAVDVTYRQLRFQLARKLALPSTLEDNALAEAAAERLGWDRSDIQRLVMSAGVAAHPPDVPWRQALELVRSMHTYSHRLKVPRAHAVEKG